MDTLIINLYSGPGSGKSTLCAGLFAELKLRGIECEMSREYAKDVVWEGRTHLLDNQLYLFAKQLKPLEDLRGKVRVVVTDAPLMLSVVYGREAFDTTSQRGNFSRLVRETYSRFDNRNVYVRRVKPYHQAGRVQTADEAEDLDMIIGGTIAGHDYAIDLAVSGDREGLSCLVDYVLDEIGYTPE